MVARSQIESVEGLAVTGQAIFAGTSPLASALRRTRELALHRTEICFFAREGLPPECQSRVEGLQCWSVSSPAVLRNLPGSEELARTRFARGDGAYVATTADEVVAVTWVRTEPQLIWDVRTELVPAPGQAVIYGVYTAPSQRHKLVATALEGSVAESLSRQGISCCLRFVTSDNHAGLAAAARSGYAEFARVTFLRALGLKIHLARWANGSRKARLSLPWSKRTLRLSYPVSGGG